MLEVGCGDGRLTWRYAEHTRSVLGLDPNATAIEHARANLLGQTEAVRHRVTFRVADITSGALPRAAFDVVVLA